MAPYVKRTVKGLSSKVFTVDPIAGAHFSKIVSVMSSAYKRHGTILERSFLEVLSDYPDLMVWNEANFWVPSGVDHIVRASIADPTHLFGTNMPYTGSGARQLQIDLMVYNKNTRTFCAYEIKRGNGKHDAGKQRSMLVDTMCTQILLHGYAGTRGLEPVSVRSYVIFYYGQCSLKAPFAIKGTDVDAHFEKPISDQIEEVNELFRRELFSILSAA